MKSSTRTTWILALVCAALGWVFAGAENDDHRLPPEARRSSHRSDRPAADGRAEANAKSRVRSMRVGADPNEKIRRAIGLAQSLPADELMQWYANDWFKIGDGLDATVFYRVARGRLVREMPVELMDFCLMRASTNTADAAREWALLDPHAAVSYFTAKRYDIQASHAMIPSGFASLAESAPILAIEAMTEFQKTGDPNQRRLFEDALEILADEHSESLRDQMAAWTPQLREAAEMQLRKADLRNDFMAGIAATEDRGEVHEFVQNVADARVFSQLIKHAGDLPAGWLDQVLKNPYQFSRSQLTQLNDLDLDVLGASAAAQQQMEQYLKDSNVVWTADRDDESKALPTAAEYFERRSLADPEASAPPSPPHWSSQRTRELGDAFVAGTDEQKFNFANQIVQTSEIPPTITAQALDFLLISGDRSRSAGDLLQISSKLAVDWIESDPVEASSWLAGLPPGETRAYAMKNAVVRWSRDDPRAAENWISTLPPEDRQMVSEVLGGP